MGSMRQRIDAGGRQQRAIGGDGPRGVGGAAVGCFPNAAADTAHIGDDTAVRGRRRIGHDGIDASLGGSVVITAGTTRHVLGHRAKGSEAGGVQSAFDAECGIQDHALAPSRHPALDRPVLFGSRTRPGGRVVARRIRQPVVPEFFLADETLGIGGSVAEGELGRDRCPRGAYRGSGENRRVLAASVSTAQRRQLRHSCGDVQDGHFRRHCRGRWRRCPRNRS